MHKAMQPGGLTPFENEMFEYLDKQIQLDRIDASIDGMHESQNIISPARGVGAAIVKGDLSKIIKGVGRGVGTEAGLECGCEE